MSIYLLKFSACLLVFWLVYVLLLERQKMHRFKRFYLLGAVFSALIIPLSTITYYVEPVLDLGTFDPYGYATPPFIPIEIEGQELVIEASNNYLSILLWCIYSIGVAVFAIRFIINLIKMYNRIYNNEKTTQRPFIYILLQELRIPHSFFNYIFLNKLKFENNEIPKEVILHEETHAKQLHSLDIIVIELLQIILWFHPLIYILKHHIKLNHEFLADQAVLRQGTDTSNYQKILLQFSSNTHSQQLASAINYSSIKKRFTVMKTQTSKTRIWVSSLLLLPIIAILFYTFAEKEFVEKENTEIVDAIKTELEKANDLQLISKDEAINFLVTVEKNGNSIELKCESGCKWSHLILEPNSEPYIINDYGFSEGNTVETDKFAFSIKPNSSGVDLDGIKGTAWLDLNFSLTENQVQAINQLGMIASSKSPRHEKINIDLQKRAEENYYTKQFFSVKNKNGEYSKKQFNELDYEDKIKWVYTYAIPYTRIDVTKDHFEKIKVSKDYIIKVNGNYISEKELNQYKSSDFITFRYTPISKLAKIKELSVINLVTPEAYNMYCSLMINQYKEVINDFEKDIKLPENERPKDIINTYNFLYYNFKQFTPEIIQKHNFKPPTPISSTTNDKVIQKPLMWILINRKGQMLVGDELATIKDIESKLKKLSKDNKSKGFIYIKYDPEAPKKLITELKSLVKKYDFDVDTLDVTDIPPPPPPHNKKGGPNVSVTQEAYNPTFLEYIIELEQEGASFYLDDKKITSKEAKSIAKTNNGKQTEMLTQKDINGKYTVKLLSPKNIESQQKATDKQISEYNAWAKKMNKEIKKAEESNNKSPYPIIKKKEYDKYYKLYRNIMSDEQRINAEAWPNIPPPPPPPAPKVKKGESSNIPPPPPPAPESTLDFIIRMAKANAKFFNEGKSITSDEAIALIKNNDKLNINAKEKGANGEPLVYITKKPIMIGVKEKSRN